MRSYDVEVIEHVPLCGDVESVRFARPQDYTFEPGQYLVLALRTAEGVLRKPFTVSSSADAPYLEVTTRMSGSPFKRALETAGPGSMVAVSAPVGRLVAPPGTERVAFLVGGVGITPAASMVRTWRAREGRPRAVVFYGNRDAACIPFAEELTPQTDEPLTLINVVENAPDGWSGETGFITPAIVRRHIDPVAGWLFLVAGPPAMVPAMESCLVGLGVDASDARIERFGPMADVAG